MDTKEMSMTHVNRWAMLNVALIALLASMAVVVTVSGQAQATGNPLVGAWRVTEIADASGPAITNPQPGLYIFTRQHYSFARINGTRSLPDYLSNDKATDADEVAVFNAPNPRYIRFSGLPPSVKGGFYQTNR